MEKIKNIKCFLLDMDGTIYLGNKLIDGAIEFLDYLKSINKEYIFLTNNSSKDKKEYVKKLNNLGIVVNEDSIFSSGDATIHYLKKHTDCKKLYLLGTLPLKRAFQREGFEIIQDNDCMIDCVVLGFDTTITYKKLWAACDYVRKYPYIATHPDLNCPIGNNKYMPDIGAIISFIKASTGKEPLIIGKPNFQIIDSITNIYRYKKEDLCMVGDRLYTDIKMGQDLGVLSMLVLSGETSKKTYSGSSVKADYVFDSIKEIIEYL